MRTKEEILNEERESKNNAIVRDFSQNRMLETLLDIRELLQDKQKEIEG